MHNDWDYFAFLDVVRELSDRNGMRQFFWVVMVLMMVEIEFELGSETYILKLAFHG